MKITAPEFREIATRRGREDIDRLVEHVRDDLGIPAATPDPAEPVVSTEQPAVFEPVVTEKAR